MTIIVSFNKATALSNRTPILKQDRTKFWMRNSVKSEFSSQNNLTYMPILRQFLFSPALYADAFPSEPPGKSLFSHENILKLFCPVRKYEFVEM